MKNLKIRVKLIFNCPRAHAITYTNNKAGFEHNVSNGDLKKKLRCMNAYIIATERIFYKKNKKANSWEKRGENFDLSAEGSEIKFPSIRTANGR